MICGERFFPTDNPLSATMIGYVCDREAGHPPPHRRGPKVYCGEIYPKDGSHWYCNLDKNHRGLHGREPVPPAPPAKFTVWNRVRLLAFKWTAGRW